MAEVPEDNLFWRMVQASLPESKPKTFVEASNEYTQNRIGEIKRRVMGDFTSEPAPESEPEKPFGWFRKKKAKAHGFRDPEEGVDYYRQIMADQEAAYRAAQPKIPPGLQRWDPSKIRVSLRSIYWATPMMLVMQEPLPSEIVWPNIAINFPPVSFLNESVYEFKEVWPKDQRIFLMTDRAETRNYVEAIYFEKRG